MRKRWIQVAAASIIIASVPVGAMAQSTYVVKSGDTLWGVSQKQKVTVQDLMKWNNMNSTLLQVGQSLKLQNGVATPSPSIKTHKVASGDTLWDISRTYKVSLADLQSWNGLKTTNLAIGQVLKVSSGTTSPSTPTTPKPTPAPPVQAKTHTVKAGDSLYAIGLMYKASVADLQKWNGLKSTNLLIGQVLKVSAGTTPPAPTPAPVPVAPAKTHTVKVGDTLYALSRTYKVSVADLQKWNALKTSNLVVGQVLKVSGSGGTPAAPTPAPAKKTAVVTASSLYVRDQASTNGKTIGVLPNGAKVTIEKTSGVWSYIVYGNLKGWSHSDYLSIGGGTQAPKNGKVVMLDPGHGGADPGAVNGRNYEKTYTLLYASKVKSKLEQKGYTVHLTRNGDTSCAVPYSLTADLACRVSKGAQVNAKAFVSIHFNSISNAGIKRTETYYNARNDYDGKMNGSPAESKRLAEIIHRHYQPAFGSGNGGVNNTNLYVNRMSKMPATLLEAGYMSNASDMNKIMNAGTQDRVTTAIANGIDEFLK